MPSIRLPDRLALLPYLGKWLLLSVLVAALAGSASAAFLFALDAVTATRNANLWLIWLLPVAGFVVGWVYMQVGQPVEAGNNLLIEAIHEPDRPVPFRMVPLIFGGTVISHLVGASVGREGTAVQMGGALADQVRRVFKLSQADRRILLMAGMSAGFASIFGTPLAGAVFGLEVLVIGRLRYDALLPCFLAAILAEMVGRYWGVQHTHYPVGQVAALGLGTLAAVLVAGAVFGLVSRAFGAATHATGALFKRHVHYGPLRPVIGGLLLAVAVWATGAYDVIGLGIPTIVQAFHEPAAPGLFLEKMAATVLSLGSGFKGGEVTPLFFIGATLGNALAPLLDLPFAMLAGLGFVAVFAGAANTPVAGTLMAIELFGPQIGPFAALACVMAYLFSGHGGIYRAQRMGDGKLGLGQDGERSGSRD